MHIDMTDLIDRIMGLWLAPLLDDNAAAEAFRELYTDPILINGAPTTATDLVDRARMLHSAFDGLRHELLRRVDAPGRSPTLARSGSPKAPTMNVDRVGTCPEGWVAGRRPVR